MSTRRIRQVHERLPIIEPFIARFMRRDEFQTRVFGLCDQVGVNSNSFRGTTRGLQDQDVVRSQTDLTAQILGIVIGR